MSPQPLQFLLLLFAGWVNRRQLDVIEYLKEENKVLREQLGDKPIRLTDNQRRCLAARGKVLGRKLLGELVLSIGSLFRGCQGHMDRTNTTEPGFVRAAL